jgi:hypothetical protein
LLLGALWIAGCSDRETVTVTILPYLEACRHVDGPQYTYMAMCPTFTGLPFGPDGSDSARINGFEFVWGRTVHATLDVTTSSDGHHEYYLDEILDEEPVAVGTTFEAFVYSTVIYEDPTGAWFLDLDDEIPVTCASQAVCDDLTTLEHASYGAGTVATFQFASVSPPSLVAVAIGK